LNVFLEDLNVINPLSYGRTNLLKDLGSLALNLTKEMLNSHGVIVDRVVVQVLGAARLPNFSEAKFAIR
jgi:hypothetical protein